MLSETFDELCQAILDKDEKKQEKIYRRLERVGMDRMSAKLVSYDLINKKGEE